MNKREKIFSTALDLFVEHGFHGTPTSKIAKEAGVANGTLFHHFKTKEDLIIELYLYIKKNVKGDIVSYQQENRSFKESLKLMFLDYVYGIKDNPKPFKYLTQFKSSPYYSKIQENNIDDGSAAFYAFFRNAIENNEMKDLDLQLTFILISNAINGVVQYLDMNNFSKSQEHEIIAQSYEMTWRMLT
ncbi:MAG: TetR/AcrR family transcriptional regulator [Flavobacteriales bacterium]